MAVLECTFGHAHAYTGYRTRGRGAGVGPGGWTTNPRCSCGWTGFRHRTDSDAKDYWFAGHILELEPEEVDSGRLSVRLVTSS